MDEITLTVVNKKLDGSISKTTATIANNEMTFDNSITPSPNAKVYQYDEGDILTEEIFNNLEDGDIIFVDDLKFIITKHTSDEQYSIDGMSAIEENEQIVVYTLTWSSEGTKELTITSNQGE